MPANQSQILANVKLAVVLKCGTQALAGFLILVAFFYCGQTLEAWSHAPLPGAVIGMALIAAGLVALEFWRPAAGRRRAGAGALLPIPKLLNPPSRWLISHLGLLFVPAGVGIMTQANLLRHEWLPIVAALFGSTLAGLAVTGWLMQRLAPASPPAP
jgi:putative effector of murein hydrolase LrgA (UPF0299 family)